MTHQSLNPLNDCGWNCLAHTLILHEVDVLWGFCGCFCSVLESSFDSISLRSDHICYILCIDISVQGIETPVCEWNHHIYCSDLASYVFFYCLQVSWLGFFAWLSGVLYGFCLPVGLLFLLHLFVGSSVLWCLIKLIWVACRSPATCLMWCAVAFELSNFFASYLTLLAGNLSRSTLPSVIVLDTKSSAHKKNQKMSQCNIFTVSGGYFVRFTWPVQHCTICRHSYFLDENWSKDQTWLAPHWIAVYKNLQTSPSQIVSRFILFLDNPQDTYWSIPKLLDQVITFLHFWHSGRVASSHSQIISHLSFHLRNLWYNASFTIQSIFGPLMYGIYILV